MKKFKNFMFSFTFVILALCIGLFSACGTNNNEFPEKVELSSALLGEVQFENDEELKLEQNENMIKVSGTINAMSDSQKNAFGVDEVTHVVVLKLTFDDHRTLSYFKVKGKVTKVYSDDKNVDNYTGKISELLDNESNEDAYCNLILSANTKSYEIVIKYSDGQEVNLKIEINATLATATQD